VNVQPNKSLHLVLIALCPNHSRHQCVYCPCAKEEVRCICFRYFSVFRFCILRGFSVIRRCRPCNIECGKRLVFLAPCFQLAFDEFVFKTFLLSFNTVEVRTTAPAQLGESQSVLVISPPYLFVSRYVSTAPDVFESLRWPTEKPDPTLYMKKGDGSRIKVRVCRAYIKCSHRYDKLLEKADLFISKVLPVATYR
jgi:hypothetical protein